jgi:hypothetical protein
VANVVAIVEVPRARLSDEKRVSDGGNMTAHCISCVVN